MSNTSSHSEAFGLKGQKHAGLPSGASTKEGEGVLGAAGNPAGGHGEASLGRTGDEGTVGGIKQGSSDNTVPGSGGSLTTPSQGTGDVRPAEK